MRIFSPHSKKHLGLVGALLLVLAVSFSTSTFVFGQTEGSPSIESVRGMSLSPDGTIAYIVNGDQTISGFDIAKGSFVFTRLDLLPRARGISRILSNPKGDMIAVMYDTPAKVRNVALFSVDINRQGADAVVPGPEYTLGTSDLTEGGTNFAFSLDGSRLYVVYGLKTLYSFSALEKQQDIVTISGELPLEVVAGPDGEVYTLNKKTETLGILQMEGNFSSRTVELGNNPEKLLFNEKTGLVYASHSGSDDVYIVDPKRGVVVQRIKVGSDSVSMDYDKKTGDVFVANSTSGDMTIIHSDFSIETIELNSPAYFNSEPLTLSYLNATRQVFLVNTSEARYFVYSVAKSEIVKTGSTDAFPVNVFTSERTGDAYIWSRGGNSVKVINGGSLLEEEIVGGDSSERYLSRPQSVAIDSVSGRVFVSNLGGDYVTVIDGETQQPIERIIVGPAIQTLFINQETRKLYAVSPSDSRFSVFDLTKRSSQKKTVSLPQQPRGGAINETTNEIYYSNSATDEMSVVDGNLDEVTATVQLPRGGFPLVATVDEKRNNVYVALYGGSSIAVIDGGTHSVSGVIATAPNPIWVRYIPELDTIFASVEGGGEVLVIDPATEKQVEKLVVSGIPYRIFFDKETGYLYVNRRDRNQVSVFKPLGVGKKFQLVVERPIKYWGETDSTYNMVAYNENTNLAYFTAGGTDRVVVVSVGHDAEGVVVGTEVAVIHADGSTSYADGSTKTIADTHPSFFSALYREIIIGGIVFLVIVSGAVASVVVSRRRKTIVETNDTTGPIA